ncbi:uncharacterized protein B0H18DRAFT_438041 [Fomitopsis serialis]|uniref:uncharacterized protein n=1 Tax=Fomitopsis serialis TaxID=139415 RepID=UPI0020076CB4|nr:uncharacterized protein B0H18DRAFT_438041 [Neoantrodia serialis]KAH9924190.1 hypothetical protein B0H18DRAFT_438041 [Neoantrodia serialis]
MKLPRWFARRSRQVPGLLAPTAARITRRCSSVKHKLRSVPYICKTKHDCIVCQTIIHDNEIHLRCGHHYHVDACSTSSSLQPMTSPVPPSCCQQPIRERLFKRYMSPALASTYREKCAEFSTVRRVYCSILLAAASWALGRTRWTPLITTVPFAPRVRAAAAGPPSPCHRRPAARLQGRSLPTRGARPRSQRGWTRCPACDQMIELHSGCYHMTCVCAMQFCYVCGSPWKTCVCPQWEQVELGTLDAQPIFAPPIDATRPPTPPPKPTRPESDLKWREVIRGRYTRSSTRRMA